ncbi:MAG: hypothetical protein MUO26_09610 [Methanotrichaceae archaeon]|nr:hypothetical protein [Methanotrichaceae archaeon]
MIWSRPSVWGIHCDVILSYSNFLAAKEMPGEMLWLGIYMEFNHPSEGVPPVIPSKLFSE